MDGDEVVLRQFRRTLGGVLLALTVSSSGSVIATQPTTTTSTVAPPIEPPQWGVPTDQRLRGELPLYEGVLDDLNFHDEMVTKIDAAKASMLRYKNLTFKDAEVYDPKLSPYEIGAWAVAYLVHKTSPNVLLDTFYPNIAQLGWVKTFKLSFGMSPAEFEKEFMKFMKLTTDEQTPIL